MYLKTVLLFLVYIQISVARDSSSKWHYQCTEGYCLKTLTTPNTTSPLSLAECNVLCLDYAAVWPRPTGTISVANLTEIDFGKITFSFTPNTPICGLITSAINIFKKQLRSYTPCRTYLQSKSVKSSSVHITIAIANPDFDRLTFGVDESYTVQSSQSIEDTVNVNIDAETFFGARHALETLTQLVVFDDLRKRTLFPRNVSISDGPVYSWRGIVLDTSRNFITPVAIKRTLKAMAASKLNTFHWHITDSQSFPYESKSHPELSEFGAYAPSKVYSDEVVRDIIEYARVRGIRVIPELDAPAHIGEGWQGSGVTTCFNWKPWSDYCVEPPCGQFDPSKPELYDILEEIYGDMLDQFGTDVFHMGGDEVNLGCWNETASLTNWMVNEKGWGLSSSDFYEKVWPYFQAEAAKRLYKKAGKEIPVILWSSDLTALENVTEILPQSKYIIQIWSSSTDASIQTLLAKNYSIILSNYDALYLDCGFAGWVTDGNNWCTPYKGWQLIYDNKPINIAGNKSSQVLGGETALWTEQAGTSSVDSRLWPRAAAFAETLWTEPETTWAEAQERMLIHRDRLVSLGIEADELQPEWCKQNQQTCPIAGKFNT